MLRCEEPTVEAVGFVLEAAMFMAGKDLRSTRAASGSEGTKSNGRLLEDHAFGQIGDAWDAAFEAPAFEGVGEFFAGAGIPEIHRADFDRTCAGQHELDYVLGGADSAKADDRDLHRP